MSGVCRAVTAEQSAARDLISTWASGAGGTAAAREVERGHLEAWRPTYAGLAELGLFGVAVPDEAAGAGAAVTDLCIMLEEAAAALVPGPVTSTALATLVVDDVAVLESLMSGERAAGFALSAQLRVDVGRATGEAGFVLGAVKGGVVLLPGPDGWLMTDTAAAGVVVEPLPATDFSRPLARVVLDGAPVTALSVPGQRIEDLAATLLAAEATGVARWALTTAVDYAKVREQFGRPIGSFQAIKHMCAEMLLRSEQISVAAADAGAPRAKTTRISCRLRRRWRRPPVSMPPGRMSRTASRCSVASASPGSTTRTCTCDAHTATPNCWVDGHVGCVGWWI